MARLLVCAAALLLALAAPAAANRPPSRQQTPVAFEGSAALVTYYSGVSGVLLQAGVIKPLSTMLAGLSGGAFTSVISHLALNGTTQRDLWKNIITDCGLRFGADCLAGHLDGVVQISFDALLPPNMHRLVDGKLRIAVSQLNSRRATLNDTASWVVDRWHSKQDLVSNLISTDWLPCFSGLTVYNLFRNQPVIDGGYSSGFKELCPNGDWRRCTKVSAYYVGDKANHTCDPTVCPTLAKSGCKIFDRDNIITKPIYTRNNQGFVDQWELSKILQRCPIESYPGFAPNPTPAFVPHNEAIPDIYPGKYNPMPQWDGKEVLACQWQEWATNPPADTMGMFDLVYDQGVADANAWLKEQGLLAAIGR